MLDPVYRQSYMKGLLKFMGCGAYLRSMKSLWNQLLRYFYLRKKDPDEHPNVNTRVMHGINRLSILMFLIALVVVVWRLIHRHH